MAKLHREDRKIINNACKEELIELYAAALPRFANLLLIEADVSAVNKHDLVADLLLNHHKEVLAHFDKLTVPDFIAVYRRVNRCGQPPEPVDSIMRKYYGEFVNSGCAAATPTPPVTPQPTATASASTTPSPPTAPTPAPPAAGPSSTAAAPTAAAADSAAPAIATEADTVPLPCFTLAVEELQKLDTPAAKDALLSIQRLTRETNAASDPAPAPAAAQKKKDSSSATSSVKGRVLFKQTPGATKTLAAAAPRSPIRIIANPYKPNHFIYSQEYTSDELRKVDLVILCQEQRKDCEPIAATNSIRSRRVDFQPPDRLTPPNFNTPLPGLKPPPKITYASDLLAKEMAEAAGDLPTPDGAVAATELTELAPTPTIDLTKTSSVSFSGQPEDIAAACDRLKTAFRRCFIEAQATYLRLHLHVAKARRISQAATLQRKVDAADDAAPLLLEGTEAEANVTGEIIRAKVRKETAAEKKQIQSLEAQYKNEAEKRLQVERRLLKLEQLLAANQSNHPGATLGGAATTSTPSATTPTPSPPGQHPVTQETESSAEGGPQKKRRRFCRQPKPASNAQQPAGDAGRGTPSDPSSGNNGSSRRDSKKKHGLNRRGRPK